MKLLALTAAALSACADAKPTGIPQVPQGLRTGQLTEITFTPKGETVTDTYRLIDGGRRWEHVRRGPGGQLVRFVYEVPQPR
jgi:hypothetical protein